MLIQIIIKSKEGLQGGPCSLLEFGRYDVSIMFDFKWNHCKIQNLYFQYDLHTP